MNKYKIINFDLYIKYPYQKNCWRKFNDFNLDNSDIEISLYRKCDLFNGLQYVDLQDTNTHLIMNGNDFMVVSEDWRKANIIKMNQPESFDAFTMQLFYTHAVQKHIIQIHSSLVEYKSKGIMFLGPSGIGKTTQAEL